MANENLLAQIVKNPTIPSPPGIALRVCQEASRLDCSIAKLGEIIRMDPALCAKILKMVNSALFSPPRPVTSINRALGLVGLRSMRSLVLGLSLPSLWGATMQIAQLKKCWTTSVAKAVIARELAIRLGRREPEDDMVAALLSDLGMIILHQSYPKEYSQILDHLDEVPVGSQCQMEVDKLQVSHAEVSAALLRSWGLPEELNQAIYHHHDPVQAQQSGEAVAARAYLIYFANLLALLQFAPGNPDLAREIRTMAQDRFDMSEAVLTEFLAPVGEKIQAFAALINFDIFPLVDLAPILAQSMEALGKLTVESSLECSRAVEEKKSAETEAHTWQQVAVRLQQKVIRDPLTGVYNRGFYEETLTAEFKRSVRRANMLGLLFIDMNHFKQANDCHGHLFGDLILKTVGDILNRLAGNGVVASRFGGDEFCLMAIDTSPEKLQTLADQIVREIDFARVPWQEHHYPIQAAVGGAICMPNPNLTLDQFQAAADQAMYQSKARKPSRVPISSLLTDDDARQFEEVRKRLFSTFLVENRWLHAQQVQLIRNLVPRSVFLLGRLARQQGWLDKKELREILLLQRRTRGLFGQIATEHGYVNAAQVAYLLAIQRERPHDWANTLFQTGTMVRKDAQLALQNYLQTVRDSVPRQPRMALA